MSAAALLAASPAFFTGTCGVLGLVIGSFLNVVIHRVPIMLERRWRAECAELTAEAPTQAAGTAGPYNLVVPRSCCPACQAPIGAWHNIPVLSYLWLRGRCASCSARISPRYPLVEMLTAGLSALVAWKFGFGWPTLAALVLTWFLVALAAIDIDRQLLPDSLTLPLMWIGLLLSLLAPAPSGLPVPVDPRAALIGAAAGYLSLWGIYHLFRALTAKEGMGYGDFKLLAALGAWLGWQMLLPTVIIASAVGAAVGIVLIVARGRSSSVPIPFGPFLAAGGWLMLMYGHQMVRLYLGLFPG